MGDDPYDFDISIPAGKGTYGGHAGFDDGAHGSSSDSGGESRSRSGTGSESESESGSESDGSDHRDVKARIATAAPARATMASSALDKAKSFLSKYSTKTVVKGTAGAKSTRSRRLEMSLDDEDFSLDSSGEEVKKPKAKAAVTSGRKCEESSESEDDPHQRRGTGREEEHSEDAREREEEARSEEEEDTTSDHGGERTMAVTHVAYEEYTAPRRMYEDADSIASQSQEADSIDELKVPASIADEQRGRDVSDVSENGVYEEEEFEQDSMRDAHPSRSEQATTQMDGRGKDEDSNFDYSLEFSEDAESTPPPYTPGVVEPVTGRVAPQVITEKYEPSQQEQYSPSSSRLSESIRNSYVDEEGDGEDQEEANTENVSTSGHQSEGYSYDNAFESESTLHIPTIDPVRETPNKVAIAAEEITASTAAATATPACDSMTTPQKDSGLEALNEQTERTLKSTAQPTLNSTRVEVTAEDAHPPVRSRIVIVREYEQRHGNIEKRDAATQFTGNHASIQADLVPYGMLTSSSPVPASVNGPSGESQRDTPKESACVDPPGRNIVSPPDPSEPVAPSPSLPPPPPPVFSTYGLYDPLQLPAPASMSIYKQQLLALQQQIHQKKLETERLFRDRLATRYSTLRGTDRFLQANRPSRLALWEALQRVDPSMDESKAREIARMVNESSS